VTAAHCLVNRRMPNLLISVGEHDQTTGSDSQFTAQLRVAQMIIHPQYNASINENDIALMRPERDFTFSKGVHAACLPFQFIGESFVSRSVQALGW
jgi:trypsin